jgi:nucleoside transporter
VGENVTDDAAEPPAILPRLAIGMGLFYFALGAWIVTLSSYLMAPSAQGGLAFSPAQTAWIYSASALAGLTGPLFVGLLADRLFRAERVVAGACLYSAATMILVARWCDHCQKQGVPADAAVGPLFLLLATHCLGQNIAMTVLNVVALRHLREARRRFGLARLWGTVGWIVAGNVVALAFFSRSTDPLYLAAAAHLITGSYALTLPATPPLGKGRSLADTFGLPALRLLRRREFAVLVVTAFLTTIFNQFYILYAHRYLSETGWAPAESLMTLGQFAEIFAMLLIPWLDPTRWAKRLMLLGLLGYSARAFALAWNETWAVLVIGVPPHGTGFAFFFVVASTTVDSQAPAALKASAQAMLAFVSSGLGWWIGNIIAAGVLAPQADGGVDWQRFWLTAGFGAGAVFLLFAILYPNRDRRGKMPHRVEQS